MAFSFPLYIILLLVLWQNCNKNILAASEITEESKSSSSVYSPLEDSSLLQIYVVPHSHCDAGWLVTVESYYNYSVQYILDTVVHELLQKSFTSIQLGRDSLVSNVVGNATKFDQRQSETHSKD